MGVISDQKSSRQTIEQPMCAMNMYYTCTALVVDMTWAKK